jgi:hypothetical protein
MGADFEEEKERLLRMIPDPSLVEEVVLRLSPSYSHDKPSSRIEFVCNRQRKIMEIFKEPQPYEYEGEEWWCYPCKEGRGEVEIRLKDGRVIRGKTRECPFYKRKDEPQIMGKYLPGRNPDKVGRVVNEWCLLYGIDRNVPYNVQRDCTYETPCIIKARPSYRGLTHLENIPQPVKRFLVHLTSKD